MGAPGTDQKLFVDDVVTALTGTVDAGAGVRASVEEQLRHATEEFDVRTAEAFARALLEALCQEPIDPRRLEALLILGLAHPTILESHRISMREEGERLAGLLRSQGADERAQSLLDVIGQALGSAEADGPSGSTASVAPGDGAGRSGGTSATPSAPGNPATERVAERIEALLRRADDLAARGRNADVIRCLREVVTLDSSRRDVARMIRDLRWQIDERRSRLRRRVKAAVVTLVLATLVSALVWRETTVHERYRAIPQAAQGDVVAQRARLAAIDDLVAREFVWTGLPLAIRERSSLQRSVEESDALAAQAAQAARAERAERLELAASLLSRGLLLAQQGRFQDALVDLRRALDLGGPAWEQRDAVTANVVAISDWIGRESHEKGPDR